MSAPVLLYHVMPPELVGDRLMALSELRGISPLTYAAQARKYAGREIVTARHIPQLGCFWNDVLHLSPVHPEQIRDAMRSAGHTWMVKRWAVIDAERAGLTPDNAAIWLYPKHLPGGQGYSPEDCIPYDQATVRTLTSLPAATSTYYRECSQQARPPLVFARVPHVLFKGTVVVNDHGTIDV